MSDVTIRFESEEFGGWKAVAVSRSVESLCGTFEISLLDNFAGDVWVLVPNVTVDVFIGKIQVLRGMIDRVNTVVRTDGKVLTISGRDKTADIVDCSAMNTPGKWKETNLFQLAGQLCNPFKVSVKREITPAELVKFPFKLQSGESPFEALNRANEFQGALLISDNLGRLLITKPGLNVATDVLVTGQNVVESEMTIDYSNRFSQYTVKGQKKVKNSSGWGTSETRVNFEATAVDPIIADQRYRPKLFQAEAQATQTLAQNRVNLEASVRAAKSSEVVVQVKGWTQRTGVLWPVNGLVTVNIPEMQLFNRKMLIAALTYSKSLDGGTTTSMTLRREDAYQKLIKKAVRKGTVNTYGG
jgi:prophage tail gpP-like protein